MHIKGSSPLPCGVVNPPTNEYITNSIETASISILIYIAWSGHETYHRFFWLLMRCPRFESRRVSSLSRRSIWRLGEELPTKIAEVLDHYRCNVSVTLPRRTGSVHHCNRHSENNRRVQLDRGHRVCVLLQPTLFIDTLPVFPHLL